MPLKKCDRSVNNDNSDDSLRARILAFVQLLIIALGVINAFDTSSNTSVTPMQRHAATSLILFGARHGNRNPERFIEPSPPRTWGLEGSLELNEFGHRQSRGLGGAIGRFIDNSFEQFMQNAKFISSSANRCKQTMEGILDGMSSPVRTFSTDDALLRMYAIKDCPANERAWAPISQDNLPDLWSLTHSNRRLLDYIHANTGFNGSISSAADVADNIMQMDLFKYPYPEWLERPTLEPYTKETLREAILSFAENHQIACANHEPCRNLMAGYWLDNVVSHIRNALSSNENAIVGYTSHTETTLSLMKLMGIVKNELDTTAGFLIEFKKTPIPAVRIWIHFPVDVDQHPMKLAALNPLLVSRLDSDGFLPLVTFEGFVKPYRVSDWRSACEAA